MQTQTNTHGKLHSITTRDTALLTYIDREPIESDLAADQNGIFYMDMGVKVYLPSTLQMGLIEH